MHVLEAIEERRSVKHFDPDHKIKQNDVDQLMAAAMLSPSSFNIQHWRFVLARDEALRTDLRAAAWNQAQVTDASLCIILCADVDAWNDEPSRYWEDAPQEAQELLVPMIPPFYDGKEQLQRDEAMRSVGIAAQTIMLAAKGLGYDSCPMIGFDEDKVAELIELPAGHAIGMMITVGKALKPAWPKPGQLNMSEVVIVDRF